MQTFVLVGVDRLRERLGAPDAVTRETLVDAERDHLTGRAELFANALGLSDQRLEHASDARSIFDSSPTR